MAVLLGNAFVRRCSLECSGSFGGLSTQVISRLLNNSIGAGPCRED
jgi:hypothetical protein